MTAVRLVADDLTGALDSAVQFTGVTAIDVVLQRDIVDEAGRSLALDMACRDGTRDGAVAATMASAAFFHDAGLAFKKIDSLLRGHWAAELAALVKARTFASVVLAPAFPAQGRVTRGGWQFWHPPDVGSQPVAVDIAAALAQEGLASSQTYAASSPSDVLICDASTGVDLDHVVVRNRALPGPILWCGAAGLARALAGRPPRLAAARPEPHLTLVGSNHTVSNAQLASLVADAGHLVVRGSAGSDENAAQVMACLGRHGRCVALANIAPGCSPADAGGEIAAWLDRLLPALAPPATLTVVGGETLAAVCAVLGVRRLAIRGERGAGVPSSVLVGGPWDGVLCFSKSGAFGDVDWLVTHTGRAPAHPIATT